MVCAALVNVATPPTFSAVLVPRAPATDKVPPITLMRALFSVRVAPTQLVPAGGVVEVLTSSKFRLPPVVNFVPAPVQLLVVLTSHVPLTAPVQKNVG